MIGRTAGYVEAAAGLYLFTPIDEEAALQRVFVPRCAYSHCEFGPSAEEIAARLWIGSPAELLDAIERQERMPVLPIGQSLLALGLLTPAQLDRELAKPAGDRPLGEALVATGATIAFDAIGGGKQAGQILTAKEAKASPPETKKPAATR